MVTQVTIDFSDIEEPEPMPVASYPVIVQEVQLRDSRSSEFPYLNWELRVTTGEYENRPLWLITSLSPKALWRLQAVLDNLGVYEEQVDFEVDDETNLVLKPVLVGLVGIAVIKHEQYEGRIRNRVEDLLPMGEAGKSKPKVKIVTGKAKESETEVEEEDDEPEVEEKEEKKKKKKEKSEGPVKITLK